MRIRDAATGVCLPRTCEERKQLIRQFNWEIAEANRRTAKANRRSAETEREIKRIQSERKEIE